MNSRTKSGYGTSARYTLKRLRRDRPDLAALVDAGRLSANAAAVRAGFRPKPSSRTITFSQAKSPEQVAQEIREKFGDDFAARLKEHL